MRAALLSILLISPFTLCPFMAAQSPGLELQAGLGYARAFDGGGVSLAGAIQRPLSATTSTVRHAVGGSFWYSHMSLASGYSAGRDLTGLGLRYQVELGSCCGPVRPYLAVPVQVLRSHIEERATLQAAGFLNQIPDPGPSIPVEDRMGDDWGWGTGLEVGFRFGLSPHLSAQTSVLGLYQRIYESGTRNGAWTIHGGIAYHP
jgi:hypothetical protein